MNAFLSTIFIIFFAIKAYKLRKRDWRYKILYWSANIVVGYAAIILASNWCNGWEFLWGIPYVFVVNWLITFITLIINPMGARELRRQYKVKKYERCATVGDAIESMRNNREEIAPMIELEVKIMNVLSVLNPYYNIAQVKVAKDVLDDFLGRVDKCMDMDSYIKGVRAYLLMHTPLSIQGSKIHHEIIELIGDLGLCVIYRRRETRSVMNMGLADFKCPYDEEMEWRKQNLK